MWSAPSTLVGNLFLAAIAGGFDQHALTPARRGSPLAPAISQVEERLLRAGIRVSQWGEKVEAEMVPGGCEGPVGGANSVETIRRERDY